MVSFVYCAMLPLQIMGRGLMRRDIDDLLFVLDNCDRTNAPISAIERTN
jgi:hypothetical protein